MRTRLAVAGLVAGFGTLLAPLSPASAVCGWTLEGMQQCGCLESEVAEEVDAVTTPYGAPSLAAQIVCAH